MQTLAIGIIGCGNISDQYLKFAKQFPVLDIRACADLKPGLAKAQAEKYGVPKACSVDELLADDEIDLVINLTIPAAHAEVAIKALNAGKHVYAEKPLAITAEDGKKILDTAADKGLRVGNAPDTFLGTAHQTCRKLVQDGAIGTPTAVIAHMLSGGPERWHPNPEFFYLPGGGPMLDMGPYYLTAMINLLGPIARVTGIAGIQIPQRTVGSGDRKGETLQVQTPDHVTGSIAFTSGAIGTLTTSFATRTGGERNGTGHIILYGTEGTLAVPDPNRFDDEIQLKKTDGDWETVPIQHHHPNGRSLGVADMAQAILDDRPHRASGAQAFAVLDAMLGFIESSKTGRHHELTVDYSQPAPLPTDLKDGIIQG